MATSPTDRFEMLRERDFRSLIGGQVLGQAADGFAQAILAKVLILDPLSAGTPTRILALFALTLVPYSLIGPYVGVFVDRWPRRALMQWANLIRTGLLLTLPVWTLVFEGQQPLFVAALLLMSLGRVFLATKGAVLPVLLHEHHLLSGNSLSSGAGMISALLGGAIGIFGAGVIGQDAAFVTAALIYASAAFVLGRISSRLDHPHPPSESVTEAVVRVNKELAEGVREIWVRKPARLSLIAIFVLRTIGMFVVVAAILVIKQVFPGELGDLGRVSSSAVALGAAGAGAFAGAATAPLLGRRLANGGLIVLGFAISGVAIITLGGVVNIPALLALTFLGGLGGFVSKVAVDAEVQQDLPDRLRGRAFALYDILYNLASVAAAAGMVIGGDISLRPRLVVVGIVSLIGCFVMGRTMKNAGMPLIAAKPDEAFAPRA
ncbi:MAG: MFS transporter [Actinobacteria bacterium]|nr:MFS transporter [Actinomycetota bacterium]